MMKDSLKIKHFYNRAGFGLTPREWETKKNSSLETEVNLMFRNAKKAAALSIIKAATTDSYVKNERAFLKEGSMTKREYRNERKAIYKDTKYAWLGRMTKKSPSALIERISLFWHGHFACATNEGHLVQQQLQLFRTHGLGNFRTLVNKISEDAAMMKYLNLSQNKKGSPNENYARELLELFTLGEGNYTEKDIREAAKAFTGRNFGSKGEYRFVEKHFDPGTKSFKGQTGKFDGADIINIILKDIKCARFIARKVYAYFVNKKVNTNHVNELAQVFYQSDYNIETMMRALFEADWFYDPINVGTKIKSPIDLVVGIQKTINTNLLELPNLILFIERFLGQELYRPPNVKGWDAGRSWITASTLIFRMNLVSYLLKAEDTVMIPNAIPEERKFNREFRRFRKVTINTTPLSRSARGADQTEKLVDYLMPVELQYAKKDLARNGDLTLTLRQLMSLPEYQLC